MMGLRKFRFFVIFLGLFHVWVVKGLAGRHGMDGFLLGSHHLLDDEKGKEMWLNCGLDLLVIIEQVRTSSFSFPKDSFHDTNEISSETRSRSCRSMREAIKLLYPKVNRSFLDCLRKQNFPLHIFGEDGLRNWFIDYLESLLSQHRSSRRSLADQSSQTRAPVSAEAPAPAPAPTPAPTPATAPTPSPSSSSSPAAVGAHASPPAKRRGDGPPAPPQSSHPSPRKKADPYDDLFGDHGPGNSPDAKDNSQDRPPVAPAKENNSSNQTVIIAVVLTAMGTSFFFALLLFCFAGFRDNKNYTVQSRKDDGPLLTLSDFSASQQVFGTNKVSMEGSHQSIITNEIGTEQSFGTNKVGTEQSFGTNKVGTEQSFGTNKVGTDQSFGTNKVGTEQSFGTNIVGTEQSFGMNKVGTEQLFGTNKVGTEQSFGTNKVATEQLFGTNKVDTEQSFGTNKVGALSLQTDTNKKDCDASLSTSSVVAATSEVLQAPGNVVAPKPPPSPPVMPPPFLKPSPPGAPPPPNTAPRPPGPPKAAFPPRKGNPGSIAGKKPSPLGPKAPPSPDFQFDSGSGKTKLKPFFWDKVNARPDQPMVWDNLKAGSFQFNEEMIESLFGVAAERNRDDGKKESAFKGPSPQYVRILDPKKAQNLAISLRALNVKTEEVCEALTEGNELPSELLQLLIRMAPSSEEELKLRLHCDTSQLGPAEQFLKALVDIPFAFQRMEVLLFMASLPEDLSGTAESFSTLEVACRELRSSRLFLKLLEAVLKTGNRMNDGTFRGGAQAFKLDTLLKLADVRGTDGKTTLLHFVVQEIIRSEGIRAARMHRESQLSISSLNSEDLADDMPMDSGDYFRSLGLKVVSGLTNELENVKKAAGFDADALTSTAGNLGEKLLKTKEFLKTKMEGTEDSPFLHSLRGFVEHAETKITKLLEEERRIRLLVKDTTDYFHGNTGKEEGLRLFVIVRDFLAILDKVCKQVRESAKTTSKNSRNRETPLNSPARDPSVNSPAPDPSVNSPFRDPSMNSPARDLPTMSPARDPRQLLFPAIRDRRMDWSSSDDDDDDD